MEKFTPDQFEKISRAFYREELTLGGVPFSFFGAEIYFSFINRYKVLHPVSGFQKSIKKSNWNTLAFMAHESMSQFLNHMHPSSIDPNTRFNESLKTLQTMGFGDFRYLSKYTNRTIVRVYNCVEDTLSVKDGGSLMPAAFTAGLILACYNISRSNPGVELSKLYESGPDIDQVVLNSGNYDFIEFHIAG